MKNDERGLKLNCNLCGENHETAKCPELKNMLKMVGELFARQYPHVATVVTAAKERIEALEAIVGKLPLTKDGVRVVPGADNVWRITAVADPWVVEPRRQSQPTAFVLVHTSRRRISRAEALRVAMEILRKAEQERLDLADWEAERGIDWGSCPDHRR